jgi:prepilin-type N-terminal cleavage/methylation domain-containing protein
LEGKILIIGSRLKTKGNKRGFTLIEVIIVLAIVAVLSVLSVAGFLAARKQFLVDQAAEGLLSSIREVQNNAIAVKEDSAGEDTKVWGIKIYQINQQYELISLYPSGSQLALKSEGITNLPNSITMNITKKTTTSESMSAVFIAYSSPFGKAYLANDTFAGYGSGACVWKTDATRVNKDYYLDKTCNNFASYDKTPNTVITVEISFSGSNTKSVIIGSNGDAYMQ